MAQSHEGAQRHDGHVTQALLKDRVLDQDVLQLADVLASPAQAIADVVCRPFADVLYDAPGANVLVVHAQAGDAFEDTQDFLTGAEADRHNRRGAHFVAGGADGDQV